MPAFSSIEKPKPAFERLFRNQSPIRRSTHIRAFWFRFSPSPPFLPLGWRSLGEKPPALRVASHLRMRTNLEKQFSSNQATIPMLRPILSVLSASIILAQTGFATTISSANCTAVPVGETFTFTGSGFTDTTAVSFFWNRFINEATFNVVSDTELQVTFPNVTQNIRDRYVLVESPSGSALTMAGSVVEFTGTGSVPSTSPYPTQIIAKAGSVLQGYPTTTLAVVYVESGAVLQNPPGTSPNLVIFAENDAVLDFRGTTFSPSSPPLVLYSPETTVLGSLPGPANSPGGVIAPRQITPLSLHRGVGPFTLGIRVNRTVVGNGTVGIQPDLPFIRHSTAFTVTATPDPGWMFQAWTGSVTGTNPVVKSNSGTSDKSIVATFTEGHTLATFAGSRGTIATAPGLATFAPGQVVQLTATALPGYQFVKWGGDLADETANPAPITMDADKIVTAVFEPVSPPAPVRVTAVDQPAVPVGETTTLTGSGFAGVTAVSYFWLPYIHAATFTEVSDSELRVTFPNVQQNIRDHFLLIEAPTGSTVTMNGPVLEMSGIGSTPSQPVESILVKPGAVLRGFGTTPRLVYLQSGAVLQNAPAAAPSCVIFAEDGATLDLRGTTFSTTSPPLIIHSPGTTVLGSLPPPRAGLPGSDESSRQVPSISLSRGIGPFTLGVRLNLSVVGNGTATTDPAGPFVRHSTAFTLNAVPDSGWVFLGWSGSVNGSTPVVTANSGTSDRTIVATFTNGHTLQTYPGAWGAITVDPVQETYAPGQELHLTAEPLPGYRFVRWGGDPGEVTDNPLTLTMASNQIVTAVFEPVTAPAGPRITAVDHPAVPIGASMEFTGSGFSGTSAVSFFWPPFVNSASFNEVSDSVLRVTFPNVMQPMRDRFVLVESANGSTVTMSGAVAEFTGVGSLPSSMNPFQVIVKAGAVLEGVSPGTRVLYVESGAVLRKVSSVSPNCVIFAESGATLDLRGAIFSPSSPPLFLYGPGTTIHGSLPTAPIGGPTASPAVSRQIAAPSLSRNIGPFKEGYQLVVSSEGPGSVTVEPVMEFYPRGTAVKVTANPDSGNHFIRWVGGVGGTTNPLTFSISGSFPLTARFSDRQDFFSGWRQQYFTTEELANPAISGLNADPDRDQITNSGEYAFGSDPRMANEGSGLRIDPGSSPIAEGGLRLVYTRPALAADITYILEAKQGAGDWFDGTSGDVLFDVVEEAVVPLGADAEEVTLLLRFTSGVPSSLFFRLGANLEDLP